MEATVSDEGEAARSESSEEIDPSIPRLIQKTAKSVRKECEARWEMQVAKMIQGEAAKTAKRFDADTKHTDAQLRSLEERLRAEIKASRAVGGPSATTTAGSFRDGDWQPRSVTIKGWVTIWEERFNTGLAPAEVDQWLDFFKQSESIRFSGVVDYELIENQNNRALTTQSVIPVKEGSTQKDAWSVKRAVESWLQASPETRIHRHSLRCVMEAPRSGDEHYMHIVRPSTGREQARSCRGGRFSCRH